MYIPYGRQAIDESDIQAVVNVLKSDFLTTGPEVERFEQDVADYVGARYAVAVSNGTAALHAACFAAGIGECDEVITSPITFAASANCALYCGARPVFADIKKDTYNIDPQDIEKKITDRTKAIVAVHFTGQPCEMDAIHDIADRHHLTVIEDAAHALGAEYKKRRIGGLSDLTTFSFHPVKHITTGEGGMILTNDEELYKKLVLFRSHGITRNPQMMTGTEGGWYYQQLCLGYNYRITDFQCALGSSQFKKINSFISRRKELAARYDEAFRDCENIVVPYQHEGCDNSWHLYVIQVKNVERKQVYDFLQAAGIGVNVHYIPVYRHPYYQENGYRNVCCKNAEEVYAHMISIPMYASLKNEEQDYVIKKVKEAVKDVCRNER
jgi:perosamine synthetase